MLSFLAHALFACAVAVFDAIAFMGAAETGYPLMSE